MVKIPPAMQERWAQSLGREDPLEKEMASHFTILAWKIPWRAWWAIIHGISEELDVT